MHFSVPVDTRFFESHAYHRRHHRQELHPTDFCVARVGTVNCLAGRCAAIYAGRVAPMGFHVAALRSDLFGL